MSVKMIGGTEPYLVDCTILALKKEAGESMDVSSFSSFDENTMSFLMATPFFSDVRTAFVSVIDLKEMDCPLFADYLENYSEHSNLVVRFETCDRRTAFFKQMKDRGVLSLCDKEQAVPKLADFVKKHAMRRSATFGEGALDAFLTMENYAENPSITLYNILSDLNSLVSLSPAITVETVGAISSDNSMAAVFTLISLIKEKNVAELMHQVELLRDSEIGALCALLREYRICYKKTLGISKEYGKLFADRDSAARGIDILTDAISATKKRTFPPSLILRETLLQLCS